MKTLEEKVNIAYAYAHTHKNLEELNNYVSTNQNPIFAVIKVMDTGIVISSNYEKTSWNALCNISKASGEYTINFPETINFDYIATCIPISDIIGEITAKTSTYIKVKTVNSIPIMGTHIPETAQFYIKLEAL